MDDCVPESANNAPHPSSSWLSEKHKETKAEDDRPVRLFRSARSARFDQMASPFFESASECVLGDSADQLGPHVRQERRQGADRSPAYLDRIRTTCAGSGNARGSGKGGERHLRMLKRRS